MLAALALSLFMALAPVALEAAEAAPALSPAERLADPVYLAALTAPGDDAARWDALAALQAAPLEGVVPVRNIRLPVDHHSNGRVKALLVAQEAWIHPSNTVLRASRVEVRHLSEKGRVEGVLKAESLVVDRTARIGRAFGAVAIQHEQMQMKGEGALFDLQARYVRILSGASLKTDRFGGAFSMKGVFEAKRSEP